MHKKPLLLLLTLVLIAAVAAAWIAAPGVLRDWLQASARDACSTCTLEIERVSLSLFPLSASLHGIRGRFGDREATAVEAEIPLVVLESISFWRGPSSPSIENVLVSRPEVVVIEGDKSLPEGKGAAGSGGGFRVGGIRVRDGKFTYVRLRDGREARLRVNGIEAKVEELGTRSDLRGRAARARVDAKLEDSGLIVLEVGAGLFGKTEPDPLVDVRLEIAGQDLTRLNPFFFVDDKLRLKGELMRGQGIVTVRGARAQATVTALYRDLDLKFEKGPERSGLEATLSNVIKSFKIDPENTDESRRDRIRQAVLERKPGESLVSFILRGLLEAALAVAS